MKGHGQVLLSGAFALLLVGSVVAFSVLFEKNPRSHTEASFAGAQEAQVKGPIPAGIVNAEGANQDLATKPPEEKPIEEVLLESGEDPGAVFYTSRVREALNEGNPAFARELLRQMKEEHEKSILFEEAERLVEEKGGNHEDEN